MNNPRRWLRNIASDFFRVQGNMDIVWTPQIPVIYVSNPKSGCSTIKHTLKEAEARGYEKSGDGFKRSESPHVVDDCLRRAGLRASNCCQRFVISCVRNPYARALSCYLDKIKTRCPRTLSALRNRNVESFEEYLFELLRLNPRDMNPHFRPQCINLNFPNIAYDRIFFLENTSPLNKFLARVSPNLRLETRAPHARSAIDRIRSYYTDRSVEAVQRIYANDFLSFGYSKNLSDADVRPGEFIANNRLVSAGELLPNERSRARDAAPCKTFQATLRYRRIIELKLI